MNRGIKRAVISLILCGGILAGTAAVLFAAVTIRSGKSGAEVVHERKPKIVTISVLSSNPVDDYLILTGNAEPWEAVTLSAETTGKIEWQQVEEGDEVREGQSLTKINTTTIRANMAQSRAEYDLSVQELQRIQELRNEGISSPQELDRALTNREATRARLKLAEIQLDQSSINAQISGVVDRLYNEEGEFVNKGTPLVRIIQVHKVKVVTGLPERDVSHFAAGDKVRITVDGLDGRSFEGLIHRIATSAEPTTRTFRTEIEIDNSKYEIKPGMITRIFLVMESYPDAITVPLFSMLTREDEHYVFVEQDGIANRRSVDIGFFQQDFVHVAGGLRVGDRLIVVGHRELHDGQKVEVREIL